MSGSISGTAAPTYRRIKLAMPAIPADGCSLGNMAVWALLRGKIIGASDRQGFGAGPWQAFGLLTTYVAPISALFSTSVPAAISRVIALVIVDALKCQPLRRRAHVNKEILKRQPALANGDPSGAVVPICEYIRIAAARQHSGPNPIKRRVAHAVSAAIAPMLTATARLTVAAGEIARRRNYNLLSAIAPAKPRRAPRGMQCRLYGDKVPKPSSSEICSRHHAVDYGAVWRSTMAKNIPDADVLRTLRAYAAAVPPIPISNDRRMFERLFKLGLVIGGIAYDEKGEPIGVIGLTAAGRRALDAERAA